MDSSSYTRRVRSRALSHGIYAKGVSDGELVARRSARLVQECCKATTSVEEQPPIIEPLAIVFDIDQTRAVRTMNLSLMGSGIILNGTTQIRFTGSYTQNINAASRVAIYSADLSDCLFSFESLTYYSVSGYYLPELLRAGMVTDLQYNAITSVSFTQNVPKLKTFSTYVYDDDSYLAQPFQFSIFDCARLPTLQTLVLQNVSGPLNSITNVPATLKTLSLDGNAFTGIFSIPGSALEKLSCGDNKITGFSNIPSTLKKLNALRTDLSGIFNMAGMPALEMFNADETHISGLSNIPTSIKEIGLSSTNISGVFNCSGLTNLTSLRLGTTATTGISNIPINLTDINIYNSQLGQSAADAIASALVANGKTGGRLIIINQQGGVNINVSGAPYTTLVSSGWSIF